MGSRTIGLAVCDEEEVVATPLRTLARAGGERDLSAVAAPVLGTPLELPGVAKDLEIIGDRAVVVAFQAEGEGLLHNVVVASWEVEEQLWKQHEDPPAL